MLFLFDKAKIKEMLKEDLTYQEYMDKYYPKK